MMETRKSNLAEKNVLSLVGDLDVEHFKELITYSLKRMKIEGVPASDQANLTANILLKRLQYNAAKYLDFIKHVEKKLTKNSDEICDQEKFVDCLIGVIIEAIEDEFPSLDVEKYKKRSNK